MSIAASNSARFAAGRHGAGLQYSVGIQRVGRWFSFSASTTIASPSFQDVSATRYNPSPRRVDRIAMGLSLRRIGNFNLAYAAVTGGTVLDALSGVQARDARVASLTFSRPISRRLQFYATAYRDLTDHDSGATLGLVIPLGRRSSASVTGGLDEGRPAVGAEIQQAALRPGDVGWSVLVNQGANPRQDAQASYMSGIGTVATEVDHVGTQTGVRGELVGSVVAVRQGAFLANWVNDSFAVVDTNGVAGVTVEQENRPIGRTGANGLLLVPDLNGWSANRISLDPSDLPADVDVGHLQREVVPREHSGVHVSFDISRGHSAVIRLVDAKGVAIAPGSIAILQSSGLHSPVGYDGEVFFRDLAGSNRIRVQVRGGECESTVAFTARRDDLPVIGPIPCLKVAR